MYRIFGSFKRVKRFAAIFLATIFTIIGLQLPTVAQYDTGFPATAPMTQEYKDLTLEWLRDFFLENQSFSGLASRGAGSSEETSDGSMNASAVLTDVRLSNAVLTITGSFAVEVGTNRGDIILDEPVSGNFTKTLQWNNSFLEETSSIRQSGFEDLNVQLPIRGGPLTISWIEPSSWRWTLSLTHKVEACPELERNLNSYVQSTGYYLTKLECLLKYKQNDAGTPTWGFHTAIYSYALMQDIVRGKLPASDLIALINSYPESARRLKGSVDPRSGILGRFPKTFIGADFLIRETDGVERVWQTIEPQLIVSPWPSSPCVYNEYPQYLDAAQFYTERACDAFSDDDLTKVVMSFNQALTAADEIDWEASNNTDFQAIVSEREGAQSTLMKFVISAAFEEDGNVQAWNSALTNAGLDEFERYRFEQILQNVPGYFTDTPLAEEPQKRQPFICALYDQIGQNNEEMAFESAVLNFIASTPGEMTQIATGLVAGNLTECKQTLSFSSSEIVKNSRAILTVLLKDAAADEAKEQAVRQACKVLNKNAPAKGRVGLVVIGVKDFLTRSCRNFISDESGSVPGRRLNTSGGFTPEELRTKYSDPRLINSQYQSPLVTIGNRNYTEYALNRMRNPNRETAPTFQLLPIQVDEAIREGRARVSTENSSRVEYHLAGRGADGRGLTVIVDENGVVLNAIPKGRDYVVPF